MALSSHTRKSNSWVKIRLGLAATTVVRGRTETALGAFYSRLSARIGKAKAVTATARKIAVFFYRAIRFGCNTKTLEPCNTSSVTETGCQASRHKRYVA